MSEQPSSPESRIAAETSADNENHEAEEAARSYLNDAPGETAIERASNAAEQAERDAQQAREQLRELRNLGRRASLAVDVLESVKRRVADDAADAVLTGDGTEAADGNADGAADSEGSNSDPTSRRDAVRRGR